eukprot:scaffold889_cov379-Prasinococcus_capsulatus_cf.AAC.8
MPEIRLGSTVVNGMSEALVNKEMSRFIGDGVDGMVGYDFLRDYDIQMDFEKKAINFYPGGSLDVGAVYGLEDMTCVQASACGRSLAQNHALAPRSPLNCLWHIGRVKR